MKQLPFILVFLFLHSTIHAQFTKSFNDAEEYRLTNMLWSEFEQLNYDKAVILIDSILQITDSPDKMALTMGLTSSLNEKNKTLVEKLLNIAASNHYSISYYRDNVSALYPVFVQKYKTVFTENEESPVGDFSLAQSLAQMFIDDQACRNQFYGHFIGMAENLGYKVKASDNFNCEEVDPENMEKLKSILIQHPDLSKKLVGSFGMEAVFFIIQHAEDSLLVSFKDRMDSWYENDDIAPNNYAIYVDRHNVIKGIPQIYGSQLSTDSDNNMVLDPIVDIENTNNRRMKMGMESIERYVSYFKIDWNEYVKNAKN